MSERNNKLDEMSRQLSEHIIAVKGTLELVDASVTEDDLHDLLIKAIERMDIIQRVSGDMAGALKNCIEKMSSIKP